MPIASVPVPLAAMMKLAPPTQYLFGTDYPAEPMESTVDHLPENNLPADIQRVMNREKCGAAVAAAEITLVRTVLSFVFPSGVPQRIGVFRQADESPPPER